MARQADAADGRRASRLSAISKRRRHRPTVSPWEIAIIKIDRDTKRGSANFVYSAEADLWRVTPESASRIAEAARPTPADFA